MGYLGSVSGLSPIARGALAGAAAPTFPAGLSRLTLLADRPLGPSTSSYSTASPSLSDRNPSPSITLKWTNTSFPLGLRMNPKPFFTSNHLTVPVMGLLLGWDMRSVPYATYRTDAKLLN